jgi:16S rRNA (uracil1498-N3)-methyltransferase
MSRQSFLDPSLQRADVGQHLALSQAERRHASVKRVESGEEVDVVDGVGTRYTCTVELSGQELAFRVGSIHDEPAPEIRTRLVQALAKGDRDLQAVETCVEIGVDAVTPWQAERSIVRWKGERAAKAHAKWQAQVDAAVKQSRRAHRPLVAELADTAALTTLIERVSAEGGLALVLHESAGSTLGAAVDRWLQDPRPTPGAEVLLVVGPEGGISEREISRLSAAGAQPVLVGSNVLRASSAGGVGLVLLRQALGYYDRPGST